VSKESDIKISVNTQIKIIGWLSSLQMHRADSSASLRSRRLLSASASQSAGPSRCSFQPDLLFPESGPEYREEMFTMSDLDLVAKGAADVVLRRSSSPWRRQPNSPERPAEGISLAEVDEDSGPAAGEQERRPSAVPELAPIAEHREEAAVSPDFTGTLTVSFSYLEAPQSPGRPPSPKQT